MKRSILGVLPALALLAGCAAFSDGPGSDPAGDGVQVAAAFYPLGWVAERVGGDRVEVELLTSPGGEPHDLELGIQETVTLAGADLVLHAEGFQAAVDEGVAQNAEGVVLDAAATVGLLPVEDGHSDDDGHDHEHEGHDHGDLDPHFWLDPLRMATLGDAVAEELAALDAGSADAYRAAAAGLRADLERLDTAYADGLARCARDTVVVSHDAFGYLSRYGLRFAPVAGLSPEAEPTPADLAALQELVREEGITTVFTERLAPPRLTATLAADLDLATAVLDPLEGLTDETADEDYLSLMRANLEALQEANGCR